MLTDEMNLQVVSYFWLLNSSFSRFISFTALPPPTSLPLLHSSSPLLYPSSAFLVGCTQATTLLHSHPKTTHTHALT